MYIYIYICICMYVYIFIYMSGDYSGDFQCVETIFSDHYFVECNALYKKETDSKLDFNIPTNTVLGLTLIC